MEKGNLDIAARGMENLIVCRALFERILPLGLEVDSIYGDEPREGAIACFAYADGGSGHVALVEEIGADTLTLSNSAYSGTEFYTETVPRDDPTDGRDNWIFQGYIYPE